MDNAHVEVASIMKSILVPENLRRLMREGNISRVPFLSEWNGDYWVVYFGLMNQCSDEFLRLMNRPLSQSEIFYASDAVEMYLQLNTPISINGPDRREEVLEAGRGPAAAETAWWQKDDP